MTFAHGGYRQPQQSSVLNYFLSLGARFDWVINLDGFNDSTMAFLGNGTSQGVHFSYPNAFVEEVAKLSVAKIDEVLGKWKRWEMRKRRLTSLIARIPFQRSAFVHLIWRAPHGSMNLTQKSLERHLAAILLPDKAKGPPNETLDLAGRLTQTWFESSRTIQAICFDRGIQYWHFLQPNQYVPKSKQFTEEEAQVALHSQNIFGPLVERAYPQLQRAGKELAKRGIHFNDLSKIFWNHLEPLYRDHCCHLNSRGNEILAREIANALDGFEARPIKVDRKSLG